MRDEMRPCDSLRRSQCSWSRHRHGVKFSRTSRSGAQFGRDNVESRTMSRLPRIGITLLLVSLPLAAQTFNEAPVSDVSGYGYVSETVYAAGTNGDGFLAVGGRRGYLFAHRITADGDTLDRAGIPLALPPPSPALGGFSAGDTRTSLTPSRRAAARTATD